MSASKKRARSSDRVFLNVGGEVFQTTISTLTANSQFFSRKFSSEWSSDAEDEIFLDRDADSFRVLLSCMRCSQSCPRSVAHAADLLVTGRGRKYCTVLLQG